MRSKILRLLSFLTITFYSVATYAAEKTPFEKIVDDLSAGRTKKVVTEYLYYDGPNLWVLLAAMLIAVNLVHLASDIGKELGGAQLGGSVGNSALTIGGSVAGFAVGKVAPAAGKGLKKLGQKMAQDSKSPPSQQQSTQSAGARNYEGGNAQQQGDKPNDTPASGGGTEAFANAGNEIGGESGEAGAKAGSVASTVVSSALEKAKNGVKNLVSEAKGAVTGTANGSSSAISSDLSSGADSDSGLPSNDTEKASEMPGRGSAQKLASNPGEKATKIENKVASDLSEAQRNKNS